MSVFGAMFAPKPFDGCRRDGTGHKARWPHCDGELDSGRSNIRVSTVKLSSSYMPPPPDGFISPSELGCGGPYHRALRERQECPREEISMVKDTYRLYRPIGIRHTCVSYSKRFYGPT